MVLEHSALFTWKSNYKIPKASNSLTGILIQDSNHKKNAITIINESDNTNTVLLTKVNPANLDLSFRSTSRSWAFFNLNDLSILNSDEDNTIPAEKDTTRAIE
mgnify:CR=1 FL=1